MIQSINKTDEKFKKNGASIREMEKVFKEFNIKARICDIDSKLIYSYDPENYFSNSVSTFNGLVKNSHIYAEPRRISKKQEENNYVLKNSSNYYINDRKDAMKFKMVDAMML